MRAVQQATIITEVQARDPLARIGGGDKFAQRGIVEDVLRWAREGEGDPAAVALGAQPLLLPICAAEFGLGRRWGLGEDTVNIWWEEVARVDLHLASADPREELM